MAKTLLHCWMGVYARVHVHFLRGVWHAFRQVFWAPYMRRCLHQTCVVCIIVHICAHACYRMCICAHVCAACSFSVGERQWGGSASSWGHLLFGVGVIFDRRKDRGVFCVFSIFNAGGSVRECMCVFTHTNIHNAQMGYSVVSPAGVGMRHLEGPKNSDDWWLLLLLVTVI